MVSADVRLELTPTNPAPAWVDGGWWPRTRDLTAELPPLLAVLSDRVGAIAFVGYHLGAWDRVTQDRDTSAGSVVLQGFTADDPQTIIVIGTSGQRLTLVVVPASTGAASALSMLGQLSRPDPIPRTRSEGDISIDQSLEDVATRLARIDGRDEARTARIARWVREAALQFLDAPVQAFVPILVEHIVRQKMGPPLLAPWRDKK